MKGLYEENRVIIESDNECSRCSHQADCCCQCESHYDDYEEWVPAYDDWFED